MHAVGRFSSFVVLFAWLASGPASVLAQDCVGDCNQDSRVAVGEAVLCIQISLGRVPLGACAAADAGDGRVGIDDLVLTVRNSVQGCPGAGPTATPTPSPTPSPSPSATATVAEIPTELEALEAWLQAGNYLDWHAESAIHPRNAASAHPSLVRVFVNAPLLASLEGGGTGHPAGSAAVKEIYDANSQFRGWAVMVKVEEDSDEGRGWYWYERVQSSLFANGRGVLGCTVCHSQGTDYFRSPFPLQ